MNKKPRIIKGICEFCGIPAKDCIHHGLEKTTKAPEIIEQPKQNDLNVGAGSLKNNIKIADIIIPHHNRHDHLFNCLNELPNDVFNIIIVSGGSFAENCNKGAKLAKTDNIIILNDDVIPQIDLFIKSCEMSADIVGFYQFVPSENKTKSGIGYALDDKGKLTSFLSDGNNKPALPAGFCVRIKKSVWEKIGGFDEIFINGSEDHDFSFKALELGLIIDYIRTPLIHKHSQSAGRFQHTVKNNKLLLEKWSDKKIIELLKLNQKKYNILITNNHLADFAGSEMWTYTMVKEFERQGHNVEVYTREPGAISDMLNYKPLNELRTEYDLIIINHNSCLKDLKDIEGFKIFTSHGIYPKLEAVANGADAYVGISQEILDHNKKYGWDLNLIYNPIDCERFQNKNKIHTKIKKVLSLCKSNEANEIVKEACDKLEIEVLRCEQCSYVEDTMNEVDLVITLGRGAYEAMACGRPVIVFDWRHYVGKAFGDGYVNKDNRLNFLKNNFSGRYSNKIFGVDELVSELKKYDKGQSNELANFSKQTFNVKKIANDYLNLWRKSKAKNKVFKFVDSSHTNYGIAKQLEKQMIADGWTVGNDGITICYGNDLGNITYDTQEPTTLQNSKTLRRAVNSKADYIFYSQKICKEFFTFDNCFYLPSAIDSKIFNDQSLERIYPIGFVGTAQWSIRKQFIDELQQSYGNDFVWNKNIYFDDIAKFYNQCEIIVNHSVVNEINMRMFEATACGALLITQEIPHIKEFWIPGKEIITYKTPQEMFRLISYYLNDKEEARKIAKAGQQRTLLEHRYSDRVKTIYKNI